MSAPGRFPGRQLLALSAVIAYPVSLHLLIVNGHISAALWLLFGVAGLYTFSTWRSSGLAARILGPLVMLLALAGLLLDDAAALYLPPVLMSAAMLQLFGHSLLPGKEPLIARFARRVEGVKSPRELDYARRLTWFWALAAAAILVESVLLALFAPLEVWSLFTNLLNYVIVAGLMVVEYLYRLLYFRRLPSLRNIANLARLENLRRWNSEQ